MYPHHGLSRKPCHTGHCTLRKLLGDFIWIFALGLRSSYTTFGTVIVHSTRSTGVRKGGWMSRIGIICHADLVSVSSKGVRSPKMENAPKIAPWCQRHLSRGLRGNFQIPSLTQPYFCQLFARLQSTLLAENSQGCSPKGSFLMTLGSLPNSEGKATIHSNITILQNEEGSNCWHSKSMEQCPLCQVLANPSLYPIVGGIAIWRQCLKLESNWFCVVWGTECQQIEKGAKQNGNWYNYVSHRDACYDVVLTPSMYASEISFTPSS